MEEMKNMSDVFTPEEKSVIYESMLQTWNCIGDDVTETTDITGRRFKETTKNIVEVVFDAGYMVHFAQNCGMTKELYEKCVKHYRSCVEIWAIKAWDEMSSEVEV